MSKDEVDEYAELMADMFHTVYLAVKDLPPERVRPAISLLLAGLMRKMREVSPEAVGDVMRGVEVAKMRLELRKALAKPEVWRRARLDERIRKATE